MSTLIPKFILPALLVLSGCAAGSGLHAQATQVHLTTGNYRVVASSIQGTSSSLKVFGIGPTATFAAAMADLRARALLTNEDGPPRALINITQDEVATFFLGPLVYQDEVVVTADVIEFLDGEAAESNGAKRGGAR